MIDVGDVKVPDPRLFTLGVGNIEKKQPARFEQITHRAQEKRRGEQVLEDMIGGDEIELLGRTFGEVFDLPDRNVLKPIVGPRKLGELGIGLDAVVTLPPKTGPW